MPATRAIHTPEDMITTRDEKLREGLKHMMTVTNTALSSAALLGADIFEVQEDYCVDGFIGGLRANGYDIVKTDDAPQA